MNPRPLPYQLREQYSSINWINYREYLTQNLNERIARERYNTSIKYVKFLTNPEETIRELLVFTPDKRLHAMKALTSLSKYLGKYDEWRQVLKKYNITWSTGKDSLKMFDELVNGDDNYSTMLTWIKNAISIIPSDKSKVIIFNTLTGLRPDEAIKSISILNNDRERYWDKKNGILQHYKFPIEFIRRTKKVYISVISDSIVNEYCPQKSSTNSYEAIKLFLKRRGMEMNMYYCRKVFSTYLRNNGIEPEIIDLLQGRIPKSIFLRHYYRPDINEIITKRIRPVLEELTKQLTS